ncbi:MAG TPA: transglycosylase SLT domain-containing protein, partial [Chloroflexia bacterium]|nr:transglycosylase SLT domain-containing protein [Chloroflexia bacterium]
MQRIHPISVHAALRLMVVTIVALLVGGIGSWPLPAGAYTSLPPAPPATGAAPALQLNRTLAPGKLTTAFAQAGAEFNVPPTVLAAIGYVESHWENRAGQPNDYQQYGIMGLRTPPGGDSLARAATLLGQAPATLQTDPTSNIRGAAALLHQLALADDKALPGTLAAWYPIVARYSAIPDPRVARSYAYSVFTILRDGVSGTTRSGETIRVPAAGALDLPDSADPLLATPASDDYGPAHW